MHQSFSFELYKQLVVLEIKKPYHVMSQSMLETGNFHSQNFKDNHNLYGMKHSRRGYSLCAGNYGYAVYPHWTASVFDYRDWQQMRYKGGDYLHFLDSIHYAEDPMYTQKLKVILTTWD
jgi:flagellum-specific peptidoglycan hydrolase FlgJ